LSAITQGPIGTTDLLQHISVAIQHDNAVSFMSTFNTE